MTGRPSGGMLVAGLRVRARVHLAFLSAAALVVAAATVGAVFAAAAQESIVRDTLSAASPVDSAVHLLAAISPDDATYRPDLFATVLKEAPASGRFGFFPERIPTMSLTTTAQASTTSGRQPTQLVSRDGFCGHVRVVAGRCPTGVGEVMTSEATVASSAGWHVGTAIAVQGAGSLRVVGVYRPASKDDPFWAGNDYFTGGAPATVDGAEVTSIDSLFTTSRTLVDRAGSATVSAGVDYPLDVDAAPIGDGAGLLRQVSAIRAATRASDFTVRTGIGGLLGSAAGQRAYVSQGAGLVALQMVLLGSVVLFFLTLDLTDGRRREIALAKLRGQSGAAVARFALAEPLAVLVAAVPIGIVIGYLGGVVLCALVLRAGTPVFLPATAIGGAGLALLGAAIAATASVTQVLRRPILAQWAPPTATRSGRAVRGARIGAVLVLVALAVLVPLRTAPGSPLVVAEPPLLLAAAALIGIPLVVRIARLVAPRSRGSRRIAGFLAVRQLARSAPAQRTAVLLVVTLGLASFAISGQSVLSMNRTHRAAAEVGASRIVSVGYNGSADPIAAVQRADPDGTWAMAAAQWLPDGGDSVAGTVLAIDPSRLPAVAVPVEDGLPATTLARLVDAQHQPELMVTGDRLTATIRFTALGGTPGPDAFVEVRTATGRLVRAELGTLREGSRLYTAAVPCGTGCAFVDFVWAHPTSTDGPSRGAITVQDLGAGGAGTTTPVAARLDVAGAWRAGVPISESTDRVRVTAEGLTDDFSTLSGEAGVAYAATAVTAPAVVSPQGLLAQRPDSGWVVTTEAGGALPIRPVRTVPLLPRVLDAGVLMDVRALDHDLQGFTQSAQWEVWLSPAAPADAVHRLDQAGLTIGASTTLTGREGELGRDGAALAFSLLLALALVAAVLAVVATAVSTGAALRGRAREAAALRLIGVPRRTVTGAAVLEQALLLTVSAIVAIPSGVLAVVVVLPLLRQSATSSPVPLDLLPDAAPVVWFALAYLVVVGGMSALAGAGVTRAAGPARLREVEA